MHLKKVAFSWLCVHIYRGIVNVIHPPCEAACAFM